MYFQQRCSSTHVLRSYLQVSNHTVAIVPFTNNPNVQFPCTHQNTFDRVMVLALRAVSKLVFYLLNVYIWPFDQNINWCVVIILSLVFRSYTFTHVISALKL